MKIQSNVSTVNNKPATVVAKKADTKLSGNISINVSDNAIVSANAKVQEIQTQIKNGTFKINPEAIADKLLQNNKIKSLLTS